MRFGETVAVYCETIRNTHIHSAGRMQYTQIQFVPHRRHIVSATKPNRLMLFGETVAVHCENYVEHLDHCVSVVKFILRPTASRPVCQSVLVSGIHLELMTRFLLLLDSSVS
jgi:hypothetical protein